MNGYLRRLVFVGAVLVGSVGVAYGQNAEEELFSTAQRAFDDGFHDVAIRYLEEFVPAYPQSLKLNQAKLLLGECQYFKNNFNKALELFKSISPVKDNQDALFFWTGETYLKLSNYPQARVHYNKLLASFPDSVYLPQALYSLGWSYFDEKRYQEAEDVFSKLTARFPKQQLSEDARLKIGQCIYNLGNYSAAIKEFNEYLLLYPQTTHAAEIQLNIADAYYYMEDFTQAMTTYEKVIKSAEDYKLILTGYSGKIWCAIKKKTYDQAQKWIKEALDLAKAKNVPAEDLFLAKADMLYEKGDWDLAVQAYNDLLQSFPNGAHRLEAHLGRGNAYYFLEKFSEAVEDFKFVLVHRQPDGDSEILAKANLGLGWAYVKLNDIEAAVKSFREVAQNSSRPEMKVNALIQLADAYHETGKLDEAVSMYQDILKAHADSSLADYVQYRLAITFLKSENIAGASGALETLAQVYPASKYLEDINYYQGVIQYKQGNWKATVEHMQNFLRGLTRPSDFAPEANYILALAYLNLKQADDALKIFQKILRLYPEDETVAKNSDIGIAKCQFELGQVKEAVKRFKLIVYKYPKTDIEQEALLWLAQYALKNSQYEQAIESYTRIIEHFPDAPQIDEIHYELGQAYEMQGVSDQALAQYKAVSSKDPALFSKVKLAIAGIFSKEFDSQKALSAYQNIALTNTEYARDAYLKIAQLYRNAQDYIKEIETYKNALKIDQGKTDVTNAELLFNIADTYEVMGHFEEAIDFYLKLPGQYQEQASWVVKAYLRVAKIFEDRQDWEGAKVTYQKIIQLKTEESKYAQERLDWLKKK
jgi:tetratricopeptide (TPR) repeat protein